MCVCLNVRQRKIFIRWYSMKKHRTRAISTMSTLDALEMQLFFSLKERVRQIYNCKVKKADGIVGLPFFGVWKIPLFECNDFE